MSAATRPSRLHRLRRDGLPFSLQIVGRLFDEATVLRAGDAYEKATPWRDKRPPSSRTILQDGRPAMADRGP